MSRETLNIARGIHADFSELVERMIADMHTMSLDAPDPAPVPVPAPAGPDDTTAVVVQPGRFALSARSLKSLDGVHADLVRVVKRAIQITPIDFVVTEGLRTRERQAQLVAAGASQTLASAHLRGEAFDIAALVDNEVRWDWPLYDTLAEAFRTAAVLCDVPLTWGGAWGRALNGYPSAADAKAAYLDDCRTTGRRPFLDGPHYQLHGRAT